MIKNYLISILTKPVRVTVTTFVYSSADPVKKNKEVTAKI